MKEIESLIQRATRYLRGTQNSRINATAIDGQQTKIVAV
jgi:hypothetical protein